MPKIPGVAHLQAIKALEKAGFRIVRQGKHVVMSNGPEIVVGVGRKRIGGNRWSGCGATPRRTMSQ